MEKIEHPTLNIQHPAARSRHHWMFDFGCWLSDVPKKILLFAIRIYQLVLSPLLACLFGPGSGCRFTPTCSQYAMDAIRERGALAGSWLAIKRICRCHPFGTCGHDPVEKAKSSIHSFHG